MTSPHALVPLTPTLPAERVEALAWPPAINAYLAAAVDSDHTRRAYRRHLTVAAEAFTSAGVAHVTDLTGAHLAAYRQWVTQPGGTSRPPVRGRPSPRCARSSSGSRRSAPTGCRPK